MNKKVIEEKIKRNEDAIDNLMKNDSIQFWSKVTKRQFHEARIIRLKERLKTANASQAKPKSI